MFFQKIAQRLGASTPDPHCDTFELRKFAQHASPNLDVNFSRFYFGYQTSASSLPFYDIFVSKKFLFRKFLMSLHVICGSIPYPPIKNPGYAYVPSHICFPIRLVFHQHLNSHIAYPDSQQNKAISALAIVYPLLKLLWSKSNNNVTRKRILDQCRTGTPLSSTALRSHHQAGTPWHHISNLPQYCRLLLYKHICSSLYVKNNWLPMFLSSFFIV